MCTITKLMRWTLAAIALILVITGSASVSVAQSCRSCPIGGYSITACPCVTDQVVRDQVASRLAGSVASPGYPITVGVCNGVVTLKGTVETQGRRDLANLFAWSVTGVVQVNNQLVPDPQVVEDMDLVGRVRSAIDKSPIDSKRIQVNAHDGVIDLTGIALSELDRDQAAWAAQATPGVRGVYNNIIVRSPSTSTQF